MWLVTMQVYSVLFRDKGMGLNTRSSSAASVAMDTVCPVALTHFIKLLEDVPLPPVHLMLVCAPSWILWGAVMMGSGGTEDTGCVRTY
jgi:hypothetical protein